MDGTDRKRIARTCNSIDRETKSVRDGWFGFPPDAIAIAGGMGGDLMTLLPMEDDPTTLQHTVYWWDHETGEVEQLADGFDDLVTS